MSDQIIQSQIAAIEAIDGDSIPAAQVKELMKSVKGMFGEHFSGSESEDETGDDKDLYSELGNLAKFINSAKKELKEVNSSQLTDKELPDASSQLEAIMSMSEKATGKIMDQCERVQSIHQTIRDRLIAGEIDPDAMAGVDDAMVDAETSITHIYEACNFQDITGQRIQKVIKVLQEIERQVLRMVVVFGLTNNDDLNEEEKAELQHDADLLSGPAMEGEGLEQDDIDGLLDKLLG